MAEYTEKQALLKKMYASHTVPLLISQMTDEDIMFKTMVSVVEEQPTADVVSKKAYEQVKWERDTAIEQLKSYGVGFCENADVVEVVRCKDCRFKTLTEDGEYNPHDIVCDYHMSDGFDENDYCSYGERSNDNV